jgi:tRNA/rRNA methyltransferase
MGIHRLVVVDPVDCDLTRVLKTATHAVEDVVASMEVYGCLRNALAPFHYIVGTTARTGAHRQTLKSPRKLAQELIGITQNNHVGILFGPEDRGLANRELKYCHALVTIPTADFASLNVAQAVMILAYEVHLASTHGAPPFVPRLASSHELEGMYDHLEETLKRIHFIYPENPEYWMNSVRRFFSRVGLQARDARIVRGFCRQMNWYLASRDIPTPSGDAGAGHPSAAAGASVGARERQRAGR